MAVLLAFALLFAPVAEAAECGNEALTAAHQIVDQTPEVLPNASAAVPDHGAPTSDVGDDLGLCQHGHCHHTGSFLPVLSVGFADHMAASMAVPALANQHALSRAPAPLERPPRI